MSQLIDTTEMYLRTIYELIEEGIAPRRARIVERLHQTGPTVSQTVGRMERDGLLTIDDDRLVMRAVDDVPQHEAARGLVRERLAPREEAIREGRFDMAKVRPVARMGYMDYCDGGDVFEMFRPRR